MSDRRDPRSIEELPLEQLIDELWPFPQPPPGFAARVLAAHHRRGALAAPAGRRPEEQRTARWPLLVALGAGGALAAALVLLVVTRGGGSGAIVRTDGQLRADERQTVRLDDRVLAVAEKGSEIAWSARADGLRVDQPRGEVFYRVDKGDQFLVVTPAGEVEVTGTCFRVAVDEPGSGRLSPRMRVEVSEGSVRARSGPSEIVLRAGEEARLSPDQVPLRTDRSDSTGPVVEGPHAASAAELRAWERASRIRALEAEARLRRLERTVALQPRPAEAAGASAGLPPRRKVYAFTAEERAALARRCEFRWGLPRHLTHWATPSVDKKLVIDAVESAAVARVMEEQRTEFMEQLRALYLEVVGDRQAVATLSAMALHHEITNKSRSGDGHEARQNLLLEWAGRRPPPADPDRSPPLERFWRLQTGAGDELVRRLQPILGPERARELALDLTDVSVRGHERNCPSGDKTGR